MSRDLETVDRSASLAMVRDRGGRRRRFMLLVANEDDQILGVVTEKELLSVPPERRGQSTAEDAMLGAEQALTVAPTEDAAKLLQTMEAEELWHLPVVLDSRVIGIVSKESLLRIIAARVINRPRFAGQP
jgi:CBS domain-containing protein